MTQESYLTTLYTLLQFSHLRRGLVIVPSRNMVVRIIELTHVKGLDMLSIVLQKGLGIISATSF